MAFASSTGRLADFLRFWIFLIAPTAARSCFDPRTAINGIAFPPLIEATMEDLTRGLESGLFTSVDLVSVGISDRGPLTIADNLRRTLRG